MFLAPSLRRRSAECLKPPRSDPAEASVSSVGPGLVGEASVTVVPELTARHLGSGTVAVFATPEMVRLMERAAVNGLAPLADGQQSVGTMVNIKHLAATPIGRRSRARSLSRSTAGG